jgi:hypothetical protein
MIYTTPIWRHKSRTPLEIVVDSSKKLHEIFEKNIYMNLIADSAFCSINTINEIKKFNTYVTMSSGVDIESEVWKVLSDCLHLNSFRMVVKNDLVFSCLCNSQDNVNTVHKLITNYFQPIECVELNETSNVINTQDLEEFKDYSFLSDDFIEKIKQKNKTELIEYHKTNNILYKTKYNKSELIHSILKIENTRKNIGIEKINLLKEKKNSNSENIIHHNHYLNNFNSVDRFDKVFFK